MAQVSVQWSRECGRIKPMHAVNNGVVKGRMSNLEDYRAAGFPYARNHDASYCEEYGVEHCVDITAIFKNFDADPTDPASYDFAVTDAYLRLTLEAGTKIFYRLGQRIEHTVKKFHVYPPKDFHKWAVICEHIIRHYNEGWADGFFWGIEYWEIWNEPDIEDLCWCGTLEEFCDLFVVTAKHLKTCFPGLKIGGPGFAGSWKWALMLCDWILARLKEEGIRLDFVSWHRYTMDPHEIAADAHVYREKLDRAGYGYTESILDEWNYCEGWFDDPFRRSVEVIIGMKGAAFAGACMCVGQDSPVDMLMYYDARPSFYNGIFDFYTLRPLKGYHVFRWFGELYRLGTQVFSESDDRDVYTVFAADGERRCGMICHYVNGEAGEKEVEITGEGKFTLYLLDGEHDGMRVGEIVLPGKVKLTGDAVLFLQGTESGKY